MRPKIENLIREEFEGVCSVFTHKTQVLGKMTGYADALFDLDLISAVKYTTMYKDIMKYAFGIQEE